MDKAQSRPTASALGLVLLPSVSCARRQIKFAGLGPLPLSSFASSRNCRAWPDGSRLGLRTAAPSDKSTVAAGESNFARLDLLPRSMPWGRREPRVSHAFERMCIYVPRCGHAPTKQGTNKGRYASLILKRLTSYSKRALTFSMDLRHCAVSTSKRPASLITFKFAA